MRQFYSIVLLIFGILLTSSPSRAAKARETAVNSIALPLFVIERSVQLKMESKEFRGLLQKKIADKLNRKTYLEVRSISKVAPLKLSPKTVKTVARRMGVEGFLVGELNGRRLRMSMLSGAGGSSLVRWVIPLPSTLDKRGLSTLAEDVVKEIVDAFPYMGYVVPPIRGRNVRLNIGKQAAISVGQKLQIFEFLGDNPDFSSEKRFLGEVEVTRVSRNIAYARQTKGARINPFAKVAFAAPNSGSRLSALDQVDRGKWATVGFDVFSIKTEFGEESSLASRDYDLAFTPFIALGGGQGPYSGELVYGKAENDFNSVTFTLLTGQYRFRTWGNAEKAWVLSGGVTYRQFKVNAADEEEEEESSDALEDATGIHPFVDLRFSMIPRGPTKFYFGGRLMALISEKGSSSATASNGLALYSGVRIDMTPDFGVESGVRAQFLKLSLADEDDVEVKISETQLTLYFRSVILF